ncbi:RNA polymerase sigma factor [Plantactinospora endophytica]|uniref:RNA polymerase sigma factor n=1 Tax=Plantactinospora endophytica TaxID=673535 RepID=A0ABQ4E047_9ACTN|nr:sigma-70 family RNA polymerase sigma factor [Plantactinospora endophytica]GIG88109.1 RNA polymerase sigma factor [Plantactinospora endophytica]
MTAETGSLLAGAAAGDRGAWDTIVTRHAGLVWAVARSLGLNATDAADVSQVTWLRLVEHLDRIRDPGALGAWLATTARREAVTLLRQRRPVAPLHDGTDVADDRAPEPWQGLLDAERAEQLWQAFGRLPERCQTVLQLLVIEPTGSYAAVAEELRVPVGSLGPTRSRCLETLRRQLRPGQAGGGAGA